MNQSLKSLSIFFLIITIGFLATFIIVLADWTAPDFSAPSCPDNVAGCSIPLNTGSATQGKIGNLGIGTLSPNSKLTVSGGNIDFAENNRWLYFRSTAGATDSYIGKYSDNNIYLHAAAGGIVLRSDGNQYFQNSNGLLTKMIITAAGNVGIGTAAPGLTGYAPALTISGVITTTSAAPLELQGYRTAADIGRLGLVTFHNYLSTDTVNAKEVAAIQAWSAGDVEAGTLRFYTHDVGTTLGERMRIDENGSVGIGTVNPTNKFNVIMANTNGASISGIYGETSIVSNSATTIGHQLKFTGTGSVGVSGTYTYTGLKILNNANTSLNSGIATNIGLQVDVSGGDNNYGLIVGSGNVGIGTAAPGLTGYAPALTISGVITTTSAAPLELQGYRTAADIGRLGLVTFHNYLSTDTVNAKEVAAIQAWSAGDVEAGTLRFYTHDVGTTLGERMRIDENGSVGIGTTQAASSRKLNVNGSGLSIGIFGNGDNYGVYGSTNTAIGILGYNSSISAGVYGSGSTYGVYGLGTSGVYGSGSTYGVYGLGTSGVYGSGSSYGVYGIGAKAGGVFQTQSTGYNLKLPARENSNIGIYLYAAIGLPSIDPNTGDNIITCPSTEFRTPIFVQFIGSVFRVLCADAY